MRTGVNTMKYLEVVNSFYLLYGGEVRMCLSMLLTMTNTSLFIRLIFQIIKGWLWVNVYLGFASLTPKNPNSPSLRFLLRAAPASLT